MQNKYSDITAQQEVLNVATYALRKVIKKEQIQDNYKVNTYLDNYLEGVVVEFLANIYESSTTKEESTETLPKVTTITEWKEIITDVPASPLEYIKYGIYKYIPRDSFFPVFFPVKFKNVVIDKVPVNTQIVEKTIIKKIKNIKTLYPDIRYEGQKQKVINHFDAYPFPTHRNF